MTFVRLIAFGLLVGCSSNDSTTKNIQQQPNPTTKSIVPDKPTFEDPPKEQSQIIFESNKEFHQKDCQGYRKHFNISKEKLPCQSDNDIHFVENDIWTRRFGISDASVYIGYREDEDSFYYRTKINFDIFFLGEHDSVSTLSFEGVDTRDVIAASCPTIFVWNYKTHKWSQSIKIFNCDETSSFLSGVGEERKTTISFDYYYALDKKRTSLTSLIHNEEIIKVRMTVWTVPNGIGSGKMVREEKRTYYIPTTEIRKEMQKAWLCVDK
jgi:hypothetical protein